ncbi:MAG: hypothetical protein N3B01_04350 [Verrucomicrobiae bacterium]|nr:hypothetical protein [Verrucomicrobiae bacterium]
MAVVNAVERENIGRLNTLRPTCACVHGIRRSPILRSDKVRRHAPKQVEGHGGLFALSENPASPEFVASHLQPAWELFLVDRHVVTCNYEKFIAGADTPQRPWRDSVAFYGHHQRRIVLADISDPSRPRQTGLCRLEAGILNGGEIQVEDGYACVTTKTG